MSVGTAGLLHPATALTHLPGSATLSNAKHEPPAWSSAPEALGRLVGDDEGFVSSPSSVPFVPDGSEAATMAAAQDFDVDRFHSDLLRKIEKFARKGGTELGAGAVIKRVALEHGVPSASWRQVPRSRSAPPKQHPPNAHHPDAQSSDRKK